MGYYVTFGKSTVKFKVENVKKIIKAIKDYNKTVPDNDKILYTHSNDIKSIFRDMDFEITKSGKYYRIEYYISEKLGDQENYLPVIAPFMEDGFIHMIGEDGNHWKWKFQKGRFATYSGRVIFDDEFHISIKDDKVIH